MRIVHDVNAPMQVMASRNGSLVHVFACSDGPRNHIELPAAIFGDNENIEIEGDPKYIRRLLQDLLDALDAVEGGSRSRKATTRSRR